MNLPNTFTTFAPLSGKVRKIGVDLTKGEVRRVYLAEGSLEIWGPDEEAVMRAWALKSLAWLKAEMQKETATTQHIREVVRALTSARAALERLSNPHAVRTNVDRAAWSTSLPQASTVEADLEIAYMHDLCDRMAAEMERQATEAAAGVREWHGCMDSAGHRFSDGVCQNDGCGVDLRSAPHA